MTRGFNPLNICEWGSNVVGFYAQVVAVWVPGSFWIGVILVHVDDGRRFNACVKFDGGREHSCSSVENLVLDCTLRILDVGSAQALDFLHLQSAILVVEALGPFAGSRGQVFVSLELPVGPGS